MIKTREDWVRIFMEGTNDIAFEVSLISNRPKVDTLTALTAAVHNDVELAALMVHGIAKKLRSDIGLHRRRSPGAAVIFDLDANAEVLSNVQ